MMKKGLTITIIFKAQTMNFGESFGNVTALKKLTRGDGNEYTYVSRQSLLYDVRRLGADIFGWNMDVLCENGTIQYDNKYTIKDSIEMDLFGYMMTANKKDKNKKKGEEEVESNGIESSLKRTAVARVSDAISLEPYRNDRDFLNNLGFANRLGVSNNLSNSEKHLSYYAYTVTIDLSKVGEDMGISLTSKEKATRVNQFLDTIKILNKNIKGRNENLAPLFVVGGVIPFVNSVFEDRVKLSLNKQKTGTNAVINVKALKEAAEVTIGGISIEDDIRSGMVHAEFANEEEIRTEFGDKALSIEGFFKHIQSEVRKVYGV